MTGKVNDIPDNAKSMYHGRRHLGWIVRRGRSFEAVQPDRTSLGVFATELLARNQLWTGGDVEP
ncbi:hypothetical protein [Bradyrhizobium sp. CCBAU 51765]|uniref:hypothetical protein n=1 Tax=Bradyrhizobium sp. CCBAU 51765 TaxID=1325102 RepID=UPI0018881D0D|nr:hypothetical protein [Bradyrhizobium sp. CCBAU 51765]QOZ09537.1 hypothetical protein XH96_19865 [Bradyrhizobium sp. CCBAU 51765]